MLIPIGGWCRTAHQVKEFLKAEGVVSLSYPYDWTITPFSALESTLSNEFDPFDALLKDSLVKCVTGSIRDSKTNLIHQHDFSPTAIEKLANTSELSLGGVPLSLFEAGLFFQAQMRFRHTSEHLKELKFANRKLGFVRWIRKGHPDKKLPYAFEGESISSLTEIISKFLGNDNFSILRVSTNVIHGAIPDNEIIAYYDAEECGVSAQINERKGFNGDGTNDFRGDAKSWQLLLNKYVLDENISLT